MKAEDLYGQLSHTGKAFDCGYYIATSMETVFFAEGEEKERDAYLREQGVYDEEVTNWEELTDYDDESFYYSEWFVVDDMDGGYDERGNYYDYVDGEFVKELDLHNDFEIVGGNGVETETWRNKETGEEIEVEIEIVRTYKGKRL